MAADMDNGSICSQLEEVIRCAICWEPPTQPKILPCQHTFCLRCLHPSYISGVRERQVSRDRIQCPLCRQSHKMPAGGLAALPTDHRTKYITDIVSRRRSAWGRKLCAVCQTSHDYRDADHFCLTCGTLMCSTCSNHHADKRLYNGHIQVELCIEDTTELNDEIFCDDHTREPIQYHCVDCQKSICRACVHTIHSAHKVVEFVSTENADFGLAKSIISYMEDRQTEIKVHRDGIERLIQISINDKQEWERELEEVRENISNLQERQHQLETFLELHHKMEFELSQLDTSLELSSINMSQLIDDTLAKAVHPIPGREDIIASNISMQTIQRKFTRLEFPIKDLELMKRQYEYLRDNDYVSNIDVDGLYYFRNIDEDINTNVKVIWNKDITAYDVHFLPGGSTSMIYSGQSLGWKLNLLDFDGNEGELPECLSGYNSSDCRLMVNHTTSTICLTHRTKDDGMVLPFSVIYPDGRVKSGTMVTPTEQVLLCGLAVTRHDDVIFTFMNNTFPPENTSLRCHYPGGEERWSRDSTNLLISPHYITVDHMDRIIISDHYANRVTLFDSKGETVLMYPEVILPDDEKEDLKDIAPKPSGICVDSKANMYVAFPNYEVVSLFNPKGLFIKHVITTTGKPRGIALCQDRYLVVCTLEHGMWMYDITGSLPDFTLSVEETKEATKQDDEKDVENNNMGISELKSDNEEFTGIFAMNKGDMTPDQMSEDTNTIVDTLMDDLIAMISDGTNDEDPAYYGEPSSNKQLENPSVESDIFAHDSIPNDAEIQSQDLLLLSHTGMEGMEGAMSMITNDNGSASSNPLKQPNDIIPELHVSDADLELESQNRNNLKVADDVSAAEDVNHRSLEINLQEVPEGTRQYNSSGNIDSFNVNDNSRDELHINNDSVGNIQNVNNNRINHDENLNVTNNNEYLANVNTSTDAEPIVNQSSDESDPMVYADDLLVNVEDAIWYSSFDDGPRSSIDDEANNGQSLFPFGESNY